MIYVTHDQIEAMTLADRIVVMQSGVIEQQGAPLDLYDRPANAFVAGFLGSPSMNFIRGQICGGTIVAEDGTVLPGGETAVHAGEGRPVLWGARPESLTQSPNGISGLVEVVEPTGPDTQLLVRVADTSNVVLLRSRSSVKSGDQIHLHVEPADIHLMDAATGVRIDTAVSCGCFWDISSCDYSFSRSAS